MYRHCHAHDKLPFEPLEIEMVAFHGLIASEHKSPLHLISTVHSDVDSMHMQILFQLNLNLF